MNSESNSGSGDEIARLRAALKQAREEKREAVMRFASGFSHDMNNLLTPIMAYGSMIKEDLPPGHEAVEFIQEILDAAEKTQQLIRTMQDVRAKGIVTGTTPLNDVVAAAVSDFRKQLPARVTLDFAPANAVLEARGEPPALRRIITELLKNAVTATQGGGTISVSTGCETLANETEISGDFLPAGNYFVVSVRDTGIGVPPEAQKHIFDPYYTKWPAGQAKGLGLAIASGLTRKFGGSIRCISTPGAGSTFEVLLKAA